jgi:hypothetical protein
MRVIIKTSTTTTTTSTPASPCACAHPCGYQGPSCEVNRKRPHSPTMECYDDDNHTSDDDDNRRLCGDTDRGSTDTGAARLRDAKMRKMAAPCPPHGRCSPAAPERSLAFRRIVVGMCKNMKLGGFCSLEHVPGSPQERACAEVFAGQEGTAGRGARIATSSVRFAGSDVDAAWRTIFSAKDTNSATVEVIASVPSQTGLQPIILASMLPYAGPDSYPAAILPCGSVYEIARGRSNAVYVCVEGSVLPRESHTQSPSSASSTSCSRELWTTPRTLSEVAEGPAGTFTVVHAAVDCRADEAWMFHGLTGASINAIYADLMKSGILGSNVAPADMSPSERVIVGSILPLIHVATCQELAAIVRMPTSEFPVVGMVSFPCKASSTRHG